MDEDVKGTLRPETRMSMMKMNLRNVGDNVKGTMLTSEREDGHPFQV